jgi:hypothetical protein
VSTFPDALDRLLERVGQGDDAAAGGRIDERRHLPRHHVADAHGPQRLEHDEGVAVGVGGAEPVEIDLVVPFAERQLVAERRSGFIAGFDCGLASTHFFVFSCVTDSRWVAGAS